MYDLAPRWVARPAQETCHGARIRQIAAQARFNRHLIPSPMPQMPVIDPQAIENLRSLNPGDNDEFLRKLTLIFLEDTPQRIVDLEESLAAADPSRFTRAAHSIKGSASNMGAMLLRDAAEKLEMHSRKEGLTAVVEMIGTIRQEFARAKAGLEEIIRSA
jgi:HPt (histidine-containing phosphotransfer) domain-containing protein